MVTPEAIEAAAIPAEAKELAREAVRKLMAGVGTRATAHDYQVMLTALTAATPSIQAQVLREAADAVEAIDPAWDSALYVDGAYHPLPDWLRARANSIEGKSE